MPFIESFRCNRCDFELPTGWGGYMYATDAQGERIVCPHPIEAQTIYDVTGLDYGDADAAGRIGFNSDCVCLACLQQFPLDLEKDKRVCPVCLSDQVKSTRELIDQPCPACKTGTVRRGSPIHWLLDDDRDSLPVPQIVKDICGFAERRELPRSLEAAEAAVRAVPRTNQYDLFMICNTLLEWWQGDFLDMTREPNASRGPLDPKVPWVRASQAVVACTPELNRLIRWQKGYWYFRDEITADERRGIKNYAREHYNPPLMS